MELPPRARRIHISCHASTIKTGTTSACAENTILLDASLADSRNYLRVRGEYPRHVDMPYSIMELPPRARRIPEVSPEVQLREGTTSACAENTR